MINVGDLILKDQKDIWLIISAYCKGNEYHLEYLLNDAVYNLFIRSSKELGNCDDLRVINV
jgi:hypothetical protein